MQRTLYLHESPGLRVSRDGPSLWVTRPHTAGQRVPVRLIRRVLIAGNVTLDTESLMVFAERGVPVTLLSRDGFPVAHVWSAAPASIVRRARQAAALEEPEVRDRMIALFRAWQRGRRLVLASRLDPGTASRWRQCGMAPTEYEAWLVEQARVRDVPLRRRRLFHGMLETLALEAVGRAGWDPHLGVLQGTCPLGLVRDCVTALEAEGDRLWLESGPREAGRPEGSLSPRVAAQLEHHRPRLHALLARLLQQYATVLGEL